jgi:hypothetical protein
MIKIQDRQLNPLPRQLRNYHTCKNENEVLTEKEALTGVPPHSESAHWNKLSQYGSIVHCGL